MKLFAKFLTLLGVVLILSQIPFSFAEDEPVHLLTSSMGDRADIWCEIRGPSEVVLGEDFTLTINVWASNMLTPPDSSVIRFLELTLEGQLEPSYYREPILEETTVTSNYDRTMKVTFHTLGISDFDIRIEVYALVDTTRSGDVTQTLTLAKARNIVVKAKSYSQLLDDMTSLNSEYEQYKKNHSYTNDEYQDALSSQISQQSSGELTLYKTLTYIIAPIAVALLASTFYFARRKAKPN